MNRAIRLFHSTSRLGQSSCLNPPMIFQSVSHPNDTKKMFTVCNDGENCIGGSKQRLLSSLLPSMSQKEIVLVATPLGLAQVALGATGLANNKTSTIFMVSPKPISLSEENSLTKLARTYSGLSIRYPDTESVPSLDAIWKQAEQYVAEDPINRYLAPVGLKGPVGSLTFTHFRTALSEVLKSVVTPPKRLWLVSGTGFLCNVLHSIWPETEFMIVVTDMTVFIPKEMENRKHQVFYSPLLFRELAPIQPPYESVPWYDAKVWEYVLKHGENGDFIWNVGKCYPVPVQKYQFNIDLSTY